MIRSSLNATIDDMSLEQLLRDQTDGVISDISQADQAYALLFLIGQHAANINGATFGGFFAPIQDILVRDYILAITKTFGVPNRNYPIRSIPKTIDLLEQSLKELRISQRYPLLRRLFCAGVDVGTLRQSSDSEITLALLNHYKAKLPSKETIEGFTAWRTLDALKSKRDKVIAHNEGIDPMNLPPVQWKATQDLLALAKSFIGVVSVGYLSYFLTDDDGNYILTSDAQPPSRCLHRLLVKAGVISPEESTL